MDILSWVTIAVIFKELVEHILIVPLIRSGISSGGTTMEATQVNQDSNKSLSDWAKGFGKELLKQTKTELGSAMSVAKDLSVAAVNYSKAGAIAAVNATPLTAKAAKELRNSSVNAVKRIDELSNQGQVIGLETFESAAESVKSGYNSAKDYLTERFSSDESTVADVEKKPSAIERLRAIVS